jgi:hypothetical protein
MGWQSSEPQSEPLGEWPTPPNWCCFCFGEAGERREGERWGGRWVPCLVLGKKTSEREREGERERKKIIKYFYQVLQ